MSKDKTKHPDDNPDDNAENYPGNVTTDTNAGEDAQTGGVAEADEQHETADAPSDG